MSGVDHVAVAGAYQQSGALSANAGDETFATLNIGCAIVHAALAIAERLDTANLIQAYALNITAHSPQQYEDARAQILARLNNQTTQGE